MQSGIGQREIGPRRLHPHKERVDHSRGVEALALQVCLAQLVVARLSGAGDRRTNTGAAQRGRRADAKAWMAWGSTSTPRCITTTSQPSDRKAWAISRPMPLVPPVTSITRMEAPDGSVDMALGEADACIMMRWIIRRVPCTVHIQTKDAPAPVCNEDAAHVKPRCPRCDIRRCQPQL